MQHSVQRNIREYRQTESIFCGQTTDISIPIGIYIDIIYAFSIYIKLIPLRIKGVSVDNISAAIYPLAAQEGWP
jgi:hypothetical protein